MLLLALLVIAPTVLVYFVIIKGLDRYEPEPFWVLSAMFLWGALGATAIAVIFNELGMGVLGATLHLDPDTELVQNSTAAVVAPLVEESTKGAGLLMLWLLSAFWLKELDGPLDGAIYGGVVGLGFTLTEDVLYVSNAAFSDGAHGFVLVYVLRTVLAGLSHASFTAMTGLAIGVATESRSRVLKLVAPLGGWLGAVGLHSLHNTLVTFFANDGLGLVLKFLVFWTFDVAFFVVIITLAVRDRAIVLRGLADEVGKYLHPKELKRTTSYWMLLPLWNYFSLQKSAGGYSQSRRKQLALVDLAFVKYRRRSDASSALAERERRLREQVATANRAGVFVGPR